MFPNPKLQLMLGLISRYTIIIVPRIFVLMGNIETRNALIGILQGF